MGEFPFPHNFLLGSSGKLLSCTRTEKSEFVCQVFILPFSLQHRIPAILNKNPEISKYEKVDWYNRDVAERKTMKIAERISVAMKAKDVSYAHVLLHCAAHIYNHTPYEIRKKRLEPFSNQFPTLCVCCLKSCSQTGKER